MITNHIMLKALDEKFKPKTRGFIDKEEMELIQDYLKLDERTKLDLMNLRDFTVMWYSLKDKDIDRDVEAGMKSMDKVSAITSVIDTVIHRTL